jgi:hypothetical protein
MAAVLQAPYTGYYTFYLCTDDVGELFVSTAGVGVQESKIASCPSWCSDGNFWKFPSQISEGLSFNRGDRIYLRIINVRPLRLKLNFHFELTSIFTIRRIMEDQICLNLH